MSLSPEEFSQLAEEVTRRMLYMQRKPITEYGDPKFTAGRPVGVHTDGYVPKSLLQKSDLTSLLAGTYSPTAHGHPFTDITGVATDAQIPAAIARDAEVAAAYATIAHTQAMSTITDYVTMTNWTPTLRFSNAAPSGIAFTTQIGQYVKIGRLVVAAFDITLSSKGAQAGNAAIFGTTLPVMASSIASTTCSMFWQNMTTSYVNMVGIASPQASFTSIGLWAATAAAASLSAVTNTNIANNTRLLGYAIYFT